MPEVVASPRAILFDLDGVLYEGNRPVAGAPEVIAWCREQAIPHLFLTNTTSRPRAAIIEKLADYGVFVRQSEILTPPVAALAWMRDHAIRRVALFAPTATRAEFDGLAVLDSGSDTGAEAVVVGDLGDGWDFKVLNRAFRLLMAEPRPALLALGMTRYWQGPSGLQLDVAPFVVALEHAAGVKATVMGKPSTAFFDTGLKMLGVNAAHTVMIGDDIKGDVGAAQALGVAGVLVRTGKFRESDLGLGITPDAVLASVAQLPEWWRAQ